MTEPTCWRVITVEEDDGFFKVTAVAYRPDKYCYIERGDPLETKVVPDFTTPPDPPTSITAQELQYELSGTVATKIYLSWPSVVGVNTYRVKWRQSAGAWTEVTAYGPSYDILNVTAGTYEIEVYSISPFGIISATAATTTIVVTGGEDPPANPTGLTIAPLTATTATLSWGAAIDLDVTVGGQVLVRHDPRAVPAANWEDSNPVIAAVPGSATSAIVTLVTGTYFVKFQDQAGNRSATAASVYTTLPSPQPVLLVKSWAEEESTPPFAGTAVNMAYSGPDGGLVLNTAGGLTGEYTHKDTFDLQGVYALNLRRYLVTGSKIVSGTPTALDADECRTYYRTTEGNPLSPSGVQWSPWTEYVNAVVQCRAVQLKVISSTTSAEVASVIENLGGFAELQQRSETGEGNGFSVYTINYGNAFYQTPSLVITPQNMQTGDYYTITASSRTGFAIEFRNSSNALITRNFTYTATGFGSQIGAPGSFVEGFDLTLGMSFEAGEIGSSSSEVLGFEQTIATSFDPGSVTTSSAGDFFSVALWDGTAVEQSITGLGFEPGFVWTKGRSVFQISNFIYDYARGATKYWITDLTLLEGTDAESLKSFDANGFTVGTSNRSNSNTVPFVGWCIAKGSTGVSNTDGSITTTTHVNSAAKFSIITYTGSGAAATIGHGLGEEPDLVIIKRLTTAQAAARAGSPLLAIDSHLVLNSTAVQTSTGSSFSGYSSTAITLTSDASVNASGSNYVAYAFASVAGSSQIGVYNGGGATATTINLGFEPQFVMIKSYSGTSGDWMIFDSARGVTEQLRANSVGTATTVDKITFNVDGFTVKANQNTNTSGTSYLYLAFR